eukprot:CAMPEP_0176457384 /NCGR_PEP_ID=MMETSP0127-20121128/31899_1 /TAXON_ID=938130 /ORGANISM="Platyophrya macrostoma, Strain WH" /LENGTH=386 /DNA_ID=CAMNT_0017847619 /DNA_START=39 /DNA_END=1199 /DNA_ORIENTATION=+
MTDPIRRDPTEFLRVLKKMSTSSSWQKSMIFASKGRMVGYRLTLDHYNTVLFSQSVWGRALEMVRVVRAMEEDHVQPNGATYYYICNGMANVEHGFNYDFAVNHKLQQLQHWRVALNALDACLYNGFDATDTMFNSTIVSCVIPGVNQWKEACHVLHKMVEEDRKVHPTMVQFFHDCLIRNMRPQEATALVKLAKAHGVTGLSSDDSDSTEVDVFAAKRRQRDAMRRELNDKLQLLRAARQTSQQKQAHHEEGADTASAAGSRGRVRNNVSPSKPLSTTTREQRLAEVVMKAKHLAASTRAAAAAEQQRSKAEEDAIIASETSMPRPESALLHATEMNSVFRPRVHRQLWYKWHAIANKYRPQEVMKKRQLSPRDSPTGIPAFYRL